MNRFRPRFFTLCFGLLVVLIAPASAIVNQYTETFTTTLKKDGLNTTADWNTAAGKLGFPPFAPAVVGISATCFPIDVFVSGDFAYVADAGDGLVVIDIGDPTNPAVVAASLFRGTTHSWRTVPPACS